jgi:hypothetical protein
MTPEDVLRNAGNPFLALGLPVAPVSQLRLKKKYKELALLFHPDKNHHPDAEAAFKVIGAAYHQLRDTAGQAGLVRRFAPVIPIATARPKPVRPTALTLFHLTSQYLLDLAKDSTAPLPLLSCPNCSFMCFSASQFDLHTAIHNQTRARNATAFRFGPHDRIVRERKINPQT